MVGHMLGRHKEGHVWARLGEAALGERSTLEADETRTGILVLETYVYDEESNAKDAIAAAERAVALASRHHSTDDLLSERLHVAMGVAVSTGGDLAGARREFQAAIDGDVARLGADNPRVADRLSDLAACEINDAQYGLALGHLDRAMAIAETIKADRPRACETILFNRAQALRFSGQYERALRDTAEATTLYAEDGSADGEDMITIETIAADCHRALGDAGAATASIEHAERIAKALPDVRAGALGELRFVRAQIMGRGDPAAVALARKARADLGDPTTPDETLRYKAIDAWLAAPPPPEH
jgi:tetratricopeptide (TPR) repeat protein